MVRASNTPTNAIHQYIQHTHNHNWKNFNPFPSSLSLSLSLCCLSHEREFSVFPCVYLTCWRFEGVQGEENFPFQSRKTFVFTLSTRRRRRRRRRRRVNSLSIILKHKDSWCKCATRIAKTRRKLLRSFRLHFSRILIVPDSSSHTPSEKSEFVTISRFLLTKRG